MINKLVRVLMLSTLPIFSVAFVAVPARTLGQCDLMVEEVITPPFYTVRFTCSGLCPECRATLGILGGQTLVTCTCDDESGNPYSPAGPCTGVGNITTASWSCVQLGCNDPCQQGAAADGPVQACVCSPQ